MSNAQQEIEQELKEKRGQRTAIIKEMGELRFRQKTLEVGIKKLMEAKYLVQGKKFYPSSKYRKMKEAQKDGQES